MPELPVLDGATARIQFEVGSGKTDTDVFHLSLVDGAVVDSGAGPIDEADFTVVATKRDFAELTAGDLGLDVGYMQGRLKVRGNVGRMLSVLPVLTTDTWVAVVADAAALASTADP